MKKLIHFQQIIPFFFLVLACNPAKQQDTNEPVCFDSAQETFDSFLENANKKNSKAIDEISAADISFPLDFATFDSLKFIPEAADGAFGIKKVGVENLDLYYVKFMKADKEAYKRAVLIGPSRSLTGCYVVMNIAEVK